MAIHFHFVSDKKLNGYFSSGHLTIFHLIIPQHHDVLLFEIHSGFEKPFMNSFQLCQTAEYPN